jgi:hypothetical protein
MEMEERNGKVVVGLSPQEFKKFGVETYNPDKHKQAT